jgi:2',3'-cyclic-nucleotide 2'-phosphodiesterase (5'-nucleotidase family)
MRILATNDLHGCLTPAKLEHLLEVRKECDLYFDSGDAIKAGNLAVPLSTEPVWERFRMAEITASCPGNRESHVLEAGVHAKFKGATHPILCCNWHRKDGSLLFPPHQIFDLLGKKIGVIGVMVPMVTDRMKTAPLSAYLWSNPVQTVESQVAELRSQTDAIILLSHLGYSQDLALAGKLDGIDLIFGGHSHTLVNPPQRVNQTWICQAGSHAKHLATYRYDLDTKNLDASIIPWPTEPGGFVTRS